MPYIVYETNGFLILGTYRTLAEANVIVGGDVNLAISPEKTIAEVEGAEPGRFYDVINGTIVDDLINDSTAGIRSSMREVRHYLNNLSQRLQEAGYAEPHIAIVKVHDFMYRSHLASFIIANRMTYTVQQKIDWAQQVVLGPSDITSPTDFYLRITTLTAPSAPFTWADPRDNSRTTVSGGLTLSGASGLNLLNNQIPPNTHIGDGGWIENLIVN